MSNSLKLETHTVSKKCNTGPDLQKKHLRTNLQEKLRIKSDLRKILA